MAVAEGGAWTPYGRGWADAQKESPKTKSGAKSGVKLALWQAEAHEDELELFAAHVAPTAALFLNPLLGTGGNSGRRAFADGWRRAAEALRPPKKSRRKSSKSNSHDAREALIALLNDDASSWVPEHFNAASWFSDANERCNNGQVAVRKGAISPWSMVLACEGLSFFAGGASRRLGAHASALGAFPFVTAAAASQTVGEADRDNGEVWVPLWFRPMTVAEIATLFARGRAEIGGRGALTPGAFAVAITRRGVDAGISEFRCFALGSTTSRETFEPRYLGVVPVRSVSTDVGFDRRPEVFERLLALIESLPPDRKEGQRWRFVGLRGPVESALIRSAAAPDDPETAAGLLDAAVRALDRVDDNRTFREHKPPVTWRPLPLEWLPVLLGGDAPGVEARLALALVSAFPVDLAFALYRFGVDWRRKSGDGRPRKDSQYIHPKTAPARWVWGPGILARNLGAVLQRRLLDWENDDEQGAPPARRPVGARLSDIGAWLDGNVDEALLARWLSRLALFDWTFIPENVRALAFFDTQQAVGPALALYGLLNPLLDLRPVSVGSREERRELFPSDVAARTAAAARGMAALIRAGDIQHAVDVARSRYAMANAPLMRMDARWAVGDVDRLLGALLFPVSKSDRAALVQRWLRPQRQAHEVTHA